VNSKGKASHFTCTFSFCAFYRKYFEKVTNELYSLVRLNLNFIILHNLFRFDTNLYKVVDNHTFVLSESNIVIDQSNLIRNNIQKYFSNDHSKIKFTNVCDISGYVLFKYVSWMESCLPLVNIYNNVDQMVIKEYKKILSIFSLFTSLEITIYFKSMYD
jgi:hypothetical protein